MNRKTKIREIVLVMGNFHILRQEAALQII